MTEWWHVFFGVVFGLLAGSFLNVVILRLPRRMEHDFRAECRSCLGLETEPTERPPGIVIEPSQCTSCGHAIRWYENIPVVSYLLLGGRCSACRQPISPQYPAVELLTAVVCGMLVWWLGPTYQAAAAIGLSCALIALSGIDIRHQLLPDAITLPLIWAGLLININAMFAPLEDAVIGAAGGYLVLWLVFHGFRLVTGREGMGYGDFKLLAGFGAWLGWQMLPLIIVLSSFVGAVIGVAMIVLRGRDRNLPIPFGPYLAIAGWIALIWGPDIMRAYLGAL